VSPDELTRVFAARILRERQARGWSLRDFAAKAGISASTINRAERGTGVWMSCAASIADALGIPLALLVTESPCPVCDGTPPAGFTCNACGRASCTP
jgi:transcriptional regulator with XRE-family HTH domain